MGATLRPEVLLAGAPDGNRLAALPSPTMKLRPIGWNEETPAHRVDGGGTSTSLDARQR